MKQLPVSPLAAAPQAVVSQAVFSRTASVEPAPGSHGGDGPAVARSLGIPTDSLLDLSASLNPFAPDVPNLARKYLRFLVPYPDDEPATGRLASELRVPQERLILTNGGAEAIALVGSILRTGEVIEPEFSLYRRHLETVQPGLGRWRSNPSNPLGELAASADRAEVWDEAFYPLATGNWTRGDEQSWRLGSLTKLWACAGLRLGYVIAPNTGAAEQVRDLRPRWSVNGLALAMVDELLEQTDLVAWSRANHSLGLTMVRELRALGYSVRSTSANWILIDRAPNLRGKLIQEGVLVRDCSSFGLAGTLRVALPPLAEVDRTLSAFDRCQSNQ